MFRIERGSLALRIRANISTRITTHLGRGGLLAALSIYQLTPADCDGAELRAQAKELATREKSLHEATDLREVLQTCRAPKERLRPLITEFTTAQDHLQRAQTALDRGNTARATNEIERASRALGGLLNRHATTAMSDCFADMPQLHRTLRNRTELLIDHLVDATNIWSTVITPRDTVAIVSEDGE